MDVRTLVAAGTCWCKFDNLFLCNGIIFAFLLLQILKYEISMRHAS